MKRSFGFALAVMLVSNAMAFELSSTEIAEGRTLGSAQVANTFGCTGGNLSPALSWKDAPAGTRSFAVTVYDPDAPTGSGWWHWLAYDIPASTTGLPAAAVVKAALPAGSKQGHNDSGATNFGGACPPPGDKPHHYIFTVHALKVEKLEVPDNASAAYIGFMLHATGLGKAQITATYSR